MNLQHKHASSKMTGHDAGCSPLLIYHECLATPTERSFPELFRTFHLRHNGRRRYSPPRSQHHRRNTPRQNNSSPPPSPSSSKSTTRQTRNAKTTPPKTPSPPPISFTGHLIRPRPFHQRLRQIPSHDVQNTSHQQPVLVPHRVTMLQNETKRFPPHRRG